MFAFFNVIWATLYLESWKRRSAELAFEWGTADQKAELLSEPRPLFTVGNISYNLIFTMCRYTVVNNVLCNDTMFVLGRRKNQ